jgi:[acyl-carrier-protein] S-malonyltransferase
VDGQAEQADGWDETRYALVFGGQGSQRTGMAVPWRGHRAFERWQEAEDVLGLPLVRLGTEADEDELREPLHCQLALFVHQAVMAEAWADAVGSRPAVTAGHSLGEYNALVAAGTLTFEEGLRLVHARAEATAAAAAAEPGGMTACMGGSADDVERAARAAGVHVCNDNAPGQLVVAGPAAALDEFESLAERSRARVRRLAVGAAYHSPAMQSAVAPFSRVLERASFRDASVPVVANVDAVAHTQAGEWPALLARQLVSPVRWRETVQRMAAWPVDCQVELGASGVLTGLAKRIAPGLRRVCIDSPSSLAAAAGLAEVRS